MKRTIITALILIIFAVGLNAQAQTVKRIQFAKGSSAAVLRGATGTKGVLYIIRAKSGQLLALTLTPAAKVGIKVEKDSAYGGDTVLLREENGGTYQVGLEESGDYSIFIGSTNGKSLPFTLIVRIKKMTDI